MCKFAITRKNNVFVAKIVNTRLAKVFMVIFALAEMPPTSSTLVDTIKLSGEYSPNYVFLVQEDQFFLGLRCYRIESYKRISIVVISIYYVYEKGELNRKGGEGAEYKTIVITANVQWAEGDAGKL